MTQQPYLTRLALAALIAGGIAADAGAAAQRTFVASYGNDTYACNLAFPCRSFDTAIGQTLPGGEVIVLDSAGYGPAAITQPVSIIAPPGIYAGISVVSGAGLTVNPGAGKVTLRGLTINSLNPAATIGISFLSGAALYVDNVTVSNFPGAGLSAAVGANANLFVTRSTFHDNGNGAVFSASAGTLSVSVADTLFARNTTGVSFQDGTTGSLRGSTVSGGTTGISISPPTPTLTAQIELRDCTISNHSGVGVDAIQVGAGAPLNLVSVVSSQISGNAIGIQATDVNSAAYVSDTMITRNGTGISPSASGTVDSGGDNRLVNNLSDGAFSSTVPRL